MIKGVNCSIQPSTKVTTSGTQIKLSEIRWAWDKLMDTDFPQVISFAECYGIMVEKFGTAAVKAAYADYTDEAYMAQK